MIWEDFDIISQICRSLSQWKGCLLWKPFAFMASMWIHSTGGLQSLGDAAY